MSKVKVCGEAVLVEISEVEEVSKGGIILSTDARKETSLMETGKVVALGPLAVHHVQSDTEEDNFLKVGDKVEFTRYAGKVVSSKIEEGKKFRIMMPDDIHLVIEE